MILVFQARLDGMQEDEFVSAAAVRDGKWPRKPDQEEALRRTRSGDDSFANEMPADVIARIRLMAFRNQRLNNAVGRFAMLTGTCAGTDPSHFWAAPLLFFSFLLPLPHCHSF